MLRLPGSFFRTGFRKLARCYSTLEPEIRDPKTWIQIEMKQDTPGSLIKALEIFKRHHVNLTHIESRLASFARLGPVFHIDFEGSHKDSKIQELLKELKMVCSDVMVCEERDVPWFPVHIRELDLTREVLDGGTDLINEDHPGFKDEEYKARRSQIAKAASEYVYGNPLPYIKYTEQEVDTWGKVWDRLKETHSKWACKEFHEVMPKLEQYCGYSKSNIPQLRDISSFLQQTTGFTLRPISGLLSARDFLNALAFRVFFSTQYIRHSGNPFYTPEPDIVHELIGHVPLLANPDFADFSQSIGLASLAASDENINILATNYWFTVEFGLVREEGQLKAFGAGLLSSFGELEWSCSPNPSQECRERGSIATSYPHLLKPEVVDYDPFEAAATAYPITTYQPKYFDAKSLSEAKTLLAKFCDSLSRPFHPQYDAITQCIRSTKSVRRAPRNSNIVALQRAKQKDFFDKVNTEKR